MVDSQIQNMNAMMAPREPCAQFSLQRAGEAQEGIEIAAA
jgi:hypothetical protein